MSHPHSDEPHKRELLNRRHFSFRLNTFFFVTFAVFTVLIVRLAILQFVEGPSLKEKETRLGYKTTAIPPLRGTIYDAGQKRLAYSTSTQSLYFNVDKNYTKEENMADAKQLAHTLADVFKEYGDTSKEKPLTAEEILKRMDLTGKLNYVFVPRLIKTGLTPKEIAYFLEHKPEYKGLDIVEDSVRNYDEDTVAVQTIGYLKKFKGVRESYDYYKNIQKNKDTLPDELRYLDYEDVGVDGIELMYQEELRGKNGLKRFPVNVAGRIIGQMELTKPERGNDLHLTIHKDIQMKTEESIMKTLEKVRNSSDSLESAPNARTGYAVAMEVKTGNVVTMASMPDYNTNVWKNGSISPEDYEKYKFNMNNGTIKAAYGPYDDEEIKKHPNSIVYLGSTMKPLSVLIGLQEKLFGLYDNYFDGGYAEFGRKGYETKVWNSSRKSFGYIDAAEALRVSSNAFMVEMIGKRLYSRTDMNGLEVWDKYMEMFGLGVKTGSGLPGEFAGLKDYLSEAERNNSQSALVYSSFGQQGKYTTLQLAQYAATLASHGKRMKPQFVSKITDGDGKIVKQFKPEVLNEVKFNDSYWDIVELGMSRVNVHGFDGFPYKFYRKTGTSQQDVGGRTIENGVFIAYAPAENPTLAVAVVVPEGGYGSYSAAPIARAIFDAYDEAVGLTGTPRKATPPATTE
ncbi:peptidoglycan D,D-transpeptidase FtsI family protein [Paenibacillus taiwanensis]|uniref:peptidoglycan D,D-transpeptidase FtsI family protein n=1 Tax=Paenibacillus taiwanensis TaxID=401638 RepID=UPI00040ED83F|nr:penicillin-binding transpeptidase domain-containing protein [Paenibacillus taiwanensis]